jgi:hypothetical protein
MSGKELIYTSIYVGVIPTSGWMICIWSQWFSQPVRKRYHKNVRNWFLKRKKVSVDIKSNASGGDAPSEVLGGFFLGQREHAHSWRYLLDILVFCPDFSDSDTKIKPPVGRDWHFQCLSWKFWNILEHMAISGVRSVPNNTNSATTLKNGPAQFVHAYAIRSTALYAVRHILKTVPKVSDWPWVRAHSHPTNSAAGEDRRALGRIGNIQKKLLKALYEKGSPKNSSTDGHALTVAIPQWPRWNKHVDAAISRYHEQRRDADETTTFQGHSGIPNFKNEDFSYWRQRACKPLQHRHWHLFKPGKTVKYCRVYLIGPFCTSEMMSST